MAQSLKATPRKGKLSGNGKQRDIILGAKRPHLNNTLNFRRIALLATDYKILSKMSANTTPHRTSKFSQRSAYWNEQNFMPNPEYGMNCVHKS
jgi:hypothetical protein